MLRVLRQKKKCVDHDETRRRVTFIVSNGNGSENHIKTNTFFSLSLLLSNVVLWYSAFLFGFSFPLAIQERKRGPQTICHAGRRNRTRRSEHTAGRCENKTIKNVFMKTKARKWLGREDGQIRRLACDGVVDSSSSVGDVNKSSGQKS